MGSRPWSFNRGSRHEGPAAEPADQSLSGLGVSISGSRSGIISTIPGPDMLLCSCRACCISLYCAAAAPLTLLGGRPGQARTNPTSSSELSLESSLTRYRWLRHRLKNYNEQNFIIIAILIMIAAHLSFLLLLSFLFLFLL